MIRPQRSLREHAAWIAVALAYVLVFPYFGKLNAPNEAVRVYTTKAIVDHGTLAIDGVEATWGSVGDGAAKDGRRFAAKAPGASLLGVPVLFVQTRLHDLVGLQAPSKRAATHALRLFAVALPLVLFIVLFGRRVERETGSDRARDLLVVGLGLGTLLYPQGLLFVGHTHAAALAFCAYLALRDARDGERAGRKLFLAGALAGLAVVFEYQAIAAVLVLAGFAVFEQRRRALFFSSGALGPALLLGALHTALLGAPWRLPYAFVDDPIFRLYHSEGLFLGLGRPQLHALAGSFVSLDYGLLVYSPFLAVGFAAAVWGAVRAKLRRDFMLVALVVVTMALFLSGMANWRAGWCAAGPRYIAVVVPFLVWALALSWKSVFGRRSWAGVALAGLVCGGVALCGIAGAHFPHHPLQFDNPIFDLSLPLIREGYVPYGLGWLLGLPGIWSYLPLMVVFGVALARALDWRDARRTAVVALVIGGIYLFAISLPGRRPHPDETHALTVVKNVWEPPPQGNGER